MDGPVVNYVKKYGLDAAYQTWRQKAGDVGMDLSKGYMVLDVETTGLDCVHDRVVEVGVGLSLPPDPPCTPRKELKVQS